MNKDNPPVKSPGFPFIRRGIYYLFLFSFFILSYQAKAQQVKPKWADNLGGTSGYAVTTYLAVDKQNNIYVTGEFQGTVDFDPSAGVKNLTSAGFLDVFVGKYKQDGTLLWVESMGGTGTDEPNGLAVDKDGNVSIAGQFFSVAFDADPGPGVYNLVGSGPENGFIIHLDANGNFVWAHTVAGTGNSEVFQVAADNEDEVITTSQFSGLVTISDTTIRSSGTSDGLIIKYGINGSVLWFIHLQGNTAGGKTASEGFISEYAISVDSQDNIVVAGVIDSTVNFNPLGPAFNLTAANDTYASFVAKYSPSGLLTWVNGIYSTYNSFFPLCTVSIDSKNNIFFSSPFVASVIFGSITLNATGNDNNICIAKYSSAGILQFAKAIGAVQGQGFGGGIGDLNGLANDGDNNLYLTGYFRNTINLNSISGTAENLTFHGQQDFYIAKYDSAGNYIYAFSAGSPSCSSTIANNLAIDNNGNIDVAGGFCSTVNFDPGSCFTESLTALGGSDGFIVQYTSAALANNEINAPAITDFCTSGTPGAIMGSVPTGGSGNYTYQWQSSADSLNFINVSGATSQNYTPPVLTSTTYYQRIANSSSCTAPGISNIVKLTIAEQPAEPVVPGVTTCSGDTATLSVTSTRQDILYRWYGSPTSDTVLFTGTSFTTPVLSAAATYYVAAINSAGCVTATRTAAAVSIVQPLATPVVKIGSTASSIVIFNWSAVPNATGYQVSIDGGKTYTPVSGLADTLSNLQGGQSVSILVQATGRIACQLSAASAEITGMAIDPNNNIIYVPNAFTPNGDGRNDQLHVRSENIQTIKFYIYDQWGELLFTSTNIQNGWDGTYKGAREPVGVYVYYLEAIMNDGQNVKKKGTITLLK